MVERLGIVGAPGWVRYGAGTQDARRKALSRVLKFGEGARVRRLDGKEWGHAWSA